MNGHLTLTRGTLTALTCTLTLLLIGCSTDAAEKTTVPVDQTPASSSSPSPSPISDASVDCPPTPLEVAIDYDLDLAGDGGVIVRVQSNLPDSAELIASMFSASRSYLAQDTQTLRKGSAIFGPFTDEGAPLIGAYDLSITFPIARNQPEQVKACIGDRGELITGPLVSENDITGDNLASIEQRVIIGSE